MITYQLPWPPSVNQYWRQWHGRTLLSERGRDYKKLVWLCVVARGGAPKLVGRLQVELFVYPPDKRRRDIDNLPKAILDALQKANVFEDDSQIDQLIITRKEIRSHGEIIVRIANYDKNQ